MRAESARTVSRPEEHGLSKRELSLDEATDVVVNSGFAPTLIGDFLLDFAQRPNGIELAISFAAVVAKARIARMKRAPGSSNALGSRRNPPPPAPNPGVASTSGGAQAER